MLIGSSTAAALCNVGKSRFHQLAQLLHLKPLGKSKGGVGVPQRLWSVSQVSAMLTMPQLLRMGVHEDSAAEFCKKFAATSDEVQEHNITSGRRWLLIAGGQVCPDLLPRESAEATVLKRAEQLSRLKLVPAIIDCGEAFLGLLEAARDHVRAESEQDA